MTGEDRLLVADEVAELMQVPVSWVREHTRNGDLPHLTLGRYKRYRRGEVLEWIDKQAMGGQTLTPRPRRKLHAAA